MDDPLRLVVVANDPLTRAGLAALLATLPEYQVIGQFDSSVLETPTNESELETADVFIWDAGWDPTAAKPEEIVVDRPVVALVGDDEQAAELWAAGVRALVPRNFELERLYWATRAAAAGLTVLAPGLNFTRPANVPADELLFDDLTPREKEVLQLVTEGLTNKAIAQQLSISEHTVKFHVNAIMGKLNAQSRTEAVVRATRLGLISL
jgi:DNA-binding NarL/FixJ family response regulator